MALDGGEDGLLFYRRIANEIPLILRNNSLLFLELGYGESEPVASLLSDAGFSDISVRNDLNGIPRMLKAAYTHKEESCSRNSIA